MSNGRVQLINKKIEYEYIPAGLEIPEGVTIDKPFICLDENFQKHFGFTEILEDGSINFYVNISENKFIKKNYTVSSAGYKFIKISNFTHTLAIESGRYAYCLVQANNGESNSNFTWFQIAIKNQDIEVKMQSFVALQFDNEENISNSEISYISLYAPPSNRNCVVILSYKDVSVKKCVFKAEIGINTPSKLLNRIDNPYRGIHIFNLKNKHYCIGNDEKNSLLVNVNIDFENDTFSYDERKKILDVTVSYPDVVNDELYAVYSKYGEKTEYGYGKIRDDYKTKSLCVFENSNPTDMNMFNTVRCDDILYHVKGNKIFKLVQK